MQYYIGARNLVQTGDPYSRTGLEQGLVISSQNCYPPLMSLVCLPLAWLRPATASYLWLGVNLILTGVLAWQLLAVIRPEIGSNWRTWILALGFLMWYPPQATGTSIGQVHALVAVLVCGAFLCARSGAEAWAGLLVGAAALLKLFPGLLVPAFLVAHRRGTAVVAALVCSSIVVLTLDEHHKYFQKYVLTGYYPTGAACFVSIPAVATRVFVKTPFSIAAVPSDRLYRCFVLSACAAVVVGLVWLLRRGPSEEVTLAAFLSAILLLTPPAGYYHLNLALLGTALLYADRRNGADRPSPGGSLTDATGRAPSWYASKFHLLLIVVVLLTAIPVEYGLTIATGGFARRIYVAIHTGWGALLLTPQTYGLVLLFAMCLYQSERGRLQAPPRSR